MLPFFAHASGAQQAGGRGPTATRHGPLLDKYLLPAGLAGALLLLAAIAIVSVRHIESLIDSGDGCNLARRVSAKSSRCSTTCRTPKRVNADSADGRRALSRSLQRGASRTFRDRYASCADHARQAQAAGGGHRIETLATQKLVTLKEGIDGGGQQPAASRRRSSTGCSPAGRSWTDPLAKCGMRAREESLLERAAERSPGTRPGADADPGRKRRRCILLLVFHVAAARKRARHAAQITAQKRAAEVEDLYNNAPCGYHSLDKDGVIVKMNDTELLWLGYTRDEVIGKKRLSDLLTPESLAKFDQQFRELKRTGIVNDVDLDLVRSDGSIFPSFAALRRSGRERRVRDESIDGLRQHRAPAARRLKSGKLNESCASAARSSKRRTRSSRRSATRCRTICASRCARWTAIRTCSRRITATGSTARASGCCGRLRRSAIKLSQLIDDC
jgi:PAS domain S-box-containing protein